MCFSKDREKVSIHGGHSGQFCTHAKNSLDEVIQAYIDQGFSWVGITEHMPPNSDTMLYPDELELNLSSSGMMNRFEEYFKECRSLQRKYAEDIEIMSSFETEAYSGSSLFVKELIAKVKPDYLVGSVHHVKNIPIDFDEALYKKAITACENDIEKLYCEYFDTQLGMLEDLKPAVVGHFDLIRIYDENYLQRIQKPEIWQRIDRNLSFIAKEELILDFNLRGFDKTTEQYPCTPILKLAIEKGIAIVPGDDSHGVASVGRNYEKGLEILKSLGVDTNWVRPKLLTYLRNK